jgi:hypothetical protein
MPKVFQAMFLLRVVSTRLSTHADHTALPQASARAAKHWHSTDAVAQTCILWQSAFITLQLALELRTSSITGLLVYFILSHTR